MHNEALGDFLEHLKKPKTVKLLEGLALAPCVSKCHSSASRAAEKLEERAIQRHRILHGSRTTSHLVDKETKKRRGEEPKITSVLSEELDCMKYIVLRETYLGTTRKTAMKLDGYYTELEQFQEATCVRDGDGVSTTDTMPDDSVYAESTLAIYYQIS